MNGRWRIFKWGAFERVTDGPDTEDVWVVPCDDAAIERAARFMFTARHGDDLGPFDDLDAVVRESWLSMAEAIFKVTAAGETP